MLDNLSVHSEKVSLIVRRMLDQTQKWAMNFNKGGRAEDSLRWASKVAWQAKVLNTNLII